jgi:hypothetical protein
MVAGVYWEWMVNRGRKDGDDLGRDYTEVRFEDLVGRPQETLARIGSFIEHDLDYDRIREIGIGSVSAPNTSFKESSSEVFNPAGRWKNSYTPTNLAMFEGLVGGTLEELGYELSTQDRSARDRAHLKRMRAMYRTYFDCKLYLKAKTPLGKLLVTRDMAWI